MRCARASETPIVLDRRRPWNMPGSMSRRLRPISSIDVPPTTCISGMALSRTSSSTVRSSSLPARSWARRRSRVWTGASGAAAASPAGTWGPGGSSRSSSRSSARASAACRTSRTRSSRTIPTAISTRSRIIDSTSRPTYPTSVNRDASTFRNGDCASFARRRAISVLPTPVGPIIRMFLGATSSAISGGSWRRRRRLRNAMATARFARCWPTTYLSSSATIWRGLERRRQGVGGNCLNADMR